ncbi:MAG: DUF971 domain-containing protein [Candidatus Binatia bacterium]|nr:DUF971 domain-containing protein [Candidatus Binatia bacterium]
MRCSTLSSASANVQSECSNDCNGLGPAPATQSSFLSEHSQIKTKRKASQGKPAGHCAAGRLRVALRLVTVPSCPEISPPLAVRRAGDYTIEILWRDGHRSVFPNAYLRANCPCALCRLENHRKTELPVANEGLVQVVGIRAVGHYAIGVLWNDDHGESIYRYDLLRQLCPCPQCWQGLEPSQSRADHR